MRFTFYKMNLSAFSCCVSLKRISCNAASLTVADTVNNFFPPYLTKERNLNLQMFQDLFFHMWVKDSSGLSNIIFFP